MRSALENAVGRYGLAALAGAIATVATHFLSGLGDAGITPLFFAAVLFSAWYGGLGPGLLCTLISLVATAFLLVEPHALTRVTLEEHIPRLIIFATIALLTSSLHGAMKRAADASRRAKESAESASAAKTLFLAMVSHELRTPLSPVLMLAEMLEEDPALPPVMLQDIQTIRRNVDLEMRLIEDLVDLTRIGAGKLHLTREVVDLETPLNAAVEVCQGDLREKELELSTEIPAGLFRVEGDAVRLQQVFWNLLRNAIKFTPAGGKIRITSRIVAKHQIAIEFADTGIGIDPPQLLQIFEAFAQGEPDIQVRFGGLGLGLAICQGIVDAHHGSITAASPGRGHGAVFTVTLPLARSVIAPPSADIAAIPATFEAAQRALIPSLVTSSDD